MFRMWGKLFKENRLIKDMVYQEESEDTRTRKIFRGIESFIYEFDLEKPIWLNQNIEAFKKNGKTRFYQDSFIEHIAFDYMEIQVIEEG
jgi:hypothetical protein